MARLTSLIIVSVLVVSASCTDRHSQTEGRSGGPGSQSTSKGSNARGSGSGRNRLRFTEVAQEVGLNERQSDMRVTGNRGMTSGAAIADVNSDGFDDIFLTRIGKPDSLYLNDGTGHFTDVAREAGVSGPTERFGSSAAAFFDADGDGHLDLFVAGAFGTENRLFINDGTGHFSNQARSRGAIWPTRDENAAAIHGVSIADVNRDGHLDLLVLHWYTDMYSSAARDLISQRLDDQTDEQGLTSCDANKLVKESGYPTDKGQAPSESRLLLNDGSGHFSDVSTEYGLDFDHIAAFTGIFQDIDADGWSDLLLTGDFCTSRVFRSIRGERFEDITVQAGVGTDENGMGAVSRDINGDGLPDWFISSIYFASEKGACPAEPLVGGCSGNRLFMNNGDGTFRDQTDTYGLRNGGWGWGIAAEDFSNQGDIQIALTNGFDWGRESSSNTKDAEYFRSFVRDSTRFWIRSDQRPGFVDVADQVGIRDIGIGHALIPFDLENDGDLDLLLASGNERPRVFRNETSPDHSWLSIRLSDNETGGNHWGDGARIEVRPQTSDSPVVGWISTNGSYESQKPPRFHIGFGLRSEDLARVDVYWPGETEPQSVFKVRLNQQLTIERARR